MRQWLKDVENALLGEGDTLLGEGRVALIIGNGNYKSAPLRNPPNDARDIANALKKLGFEVIHLENASFKDMVQALGEFEGKLRRKRVGLFFYAGHGIQHQGRNYLIPTNIGELRESNIEFETLDAGRVLAVMENAGNAVNIIILDACRNNPFRRGFRSVSSGLTRLDHPTGSLIAYSTNPENVAQDGGGRNSPYTDALLKFISQPGMTVEEVFKRVRIEVLQTTGRQQTPWESSSLTGDFYFMPEDKGVEIVNLLRQCDQQYRAGALIGMAGDIQGQSAFECYREILRREPTNPEARAGISNIERKYEKDAESALQQKNALGAQRSLAYLEIINPQSPKLFSLRQWLKDVENALKQEWESVQQRMAEKQAKDKITKALQDCQNKVNKQQLDDAVSCYQRILRDSPNESQAISGLSAVELRYREWAETELARGDFNRAEEYLAKIKAINPRSTAVSEIGNRIAVKRAEMEQRDKLVKSLSDCQRLVSADQLTAAASCYQGILSADPNNAQALKGMQTIEYRYQGWAEDELARNNLTQAEQHLARIREINPRSPILASLNWRLDQARRQLAEQEKSPPPPVEEKSTREYKKPVKVFGGF